MVADREGFTVVEVLLALLLLSFTVMGFQAATGEIIHQAAQSDRQAVAGQLIHDRLDLVRLDPRYESLASRYREQATQEPDHPGLTRSTAVVRTVSELDTGLLDYTTITVTVQGAGLREPLSRTIVIAAP